MYKQLSDISQDLNSLRENGFKRGYSIGWDFDLLPYTVKLGSTTYIAAAPTLPRYSQNFATLTLVNLI